MLARRQSRHVTSAILVSRQRQRQRRRKRRKQPA
jgi:hypothetical protein